MKQLFLFIITLAGVLGVSAQQKDLTRPPAGSAAFIDAGYEVLDYETGDLNADGRKDVLLALKIKGEDTLEESVRPLLILIRQPNGKLKLAARNDSMIMCRRCGGLFGDPYEGLSITKNGFTVNFYGGSAWRWGIAYLFAYEAATKNWWLNQKNNIYYHNAKPDELKSVTTKKEELGRVSFAQMNENIWGCNRHYIVTAAKTYFYDLPGLKSKPRKGYLVKGDKVECLSQTTNFISVLYTNSKQQSTEGYILKKDVQEVRE